MIAPERMWAPGSEPFSSTTTDTSLPCSAAQLLEADRGGQTAQGRRRRRPRRTPSLRAGRIVKNFCLCVMVSSIYFRQPALVRRQSSQFCSIYAVGPQERQVPCRFKEKPWEKNKFRGKSRSSPARRAARCRFAKVLAAAGANVVLAARRVDRLKELRAEIEAAGFAAHVSRSTSRSSHRRRRSRRRRADSRADRHPDQQLRVSNTARLVDVTPAEYDQVFDINVRGAFFMAQEVARRMIVHAKGATPRISAAASSTSPRWRACARCRRSACTR